MKILKHPTLIEKELLKCVDDAEAYFEQGKHDKTIKPLNDILKLRPGNFGVIAWLGVVYNRLHQFNKAITYLKEALKYIPCWAYLHFEMGVSYIGLGQHLKAIDSFKQAVCLASDVAPLHLLLGRRYYFLYRKVIRMAYADAMAHRSLGAFYRKLGRHEILNKAIGCYNDALKLEPDNPDALFSLGLALAEKQYDFSDPIDNYFYKAGLLYLEKGNRDKAIQAHKVLKIIKSKELARKLFEKLYPER